MFEKSDVLPRYIKYKVDVQTSKQVNDETNMVFSTHKDTANLSTKNHISQTDAINPRCARQWRVAPLGQA